MVYNYIRLESLNYFLQVKDLQYHSIYEIIYCDKIYLSR